MVTFNQMLLMFCFITIGFGLNKLKLLPQNSDTVMSKLENYIFMPALVLNTFVNQCTIENIIDKWNYIILSLFSLLITSIISILLTHFFIRNHDEKGIYRYSFIIANIAFMGNAVVNGVFGEKVLFEYLIFTLPLNIFLNSIGISWLMPQKEGSYLKKFLNPINIDTVCGIIIGISGIKLPVIAEKVISQASGCMSPIAMILTGFVIGGYNVKMLLVEKRVYALSMYRLILLPIAFWGLSILMKLPLDLTVVLICAYAMPLGLNTIVIPAAYGGDTTQGASMALVSNVLSLVTIPLIFKLIV